MKRAGVLIWIFIALVSTSVSARVTHVDVTLRQDLPHSVPSGSYGVYERLEAVVEFAFDPDNAANVSITDLHLAPVDNDGFVKAKANIIILQPKDPMKRRNVAWLEVSNRGRMASLRYFQNGGRGTGAKAYGDGLLFRQGLTLIWVGWQFDVPKTASNLWFDAPIAKNPDGTAITGTVRSDWVVDEARDALSLGHRTLPTVYRAIDFNDDSHVLTMRSGRDAKRVTVPRTHWRFSDDGRKILGDFAPGFIYELIYKSQDPPVVGAGLLAVRDMASHAKFDDSSLFSVEKVIGFGVSQTGRFLRHFLQDGLNVDEGGRTVFDGLFIHSAGAGKGSFNHRFAQPSRDAHRYSAFYYPTDIHPFTSAPTRAFDGSAKTGLLDRLKPHQIPKIMVTNTGYEYWGRAAALVHMDWQGEADVPLHEKERLYHLAGGQHFVGAMPENLTGQQPGNPLDFLVIMRALSRHLVNWVDQGIDPPESRYPKVSDDNLVPAKNLDYPAWVTADRPAPHRAFWPQFGSKWERERVIDHGHLPLAHIESLVPDIDDFGNELGGVRLPQLDVPVATYLPWSLRQEQANAQEMRDFVGHIYAVPVDLRARNKGRFLAASRKALEALIDEGFVLREDSERVLKQQSQLWDLAQ